MTADVNADVNINVSTIETEDKCGLDTSGYEGLPMTAADCNGYNNNNEARKANPKDDPDSSYIFVAGTEAVSVELADACNIDGKSEPIDKVSCPDVEVDNDAGELVVDHGGSPLQNKLLVSGEKERRNGAVEASNGCPGAIEADRCEVDLNTFVERIKESQINILEPESENNLLEVHVNGEKAEEGDNIGSTVTEEFQVISNADIAESEPNHSDNFDVECCKNIVESEKSPLSEVKVISSIWIAESEQGQPGKSEVISYNNIAESEQSQPGEAEAISSNNIAESYQSGKAEVSSTTEGSELELNQSGNPEHMFEVSSERNLVSNIDDNNDSSATFTEGVQDDNDMDLNHGKEYVGFTNNVSKDLLEASEVELAQNKEVEEAGVKLETVEVTDVPLLDECVNGLSAGRAVNSVAETGIVNGTAAPQTTPVQNFGSEELGRSGNLASSDTETAISYPASSNDVSINDSKNEFNTPVVQLESEAINGNVPCQNGETFPADHAKEVDSQADFSQPSQTSPKKYRPSEVSEAVLTDDVAIADPDSNLVSDTAMEVDNGYSYSGDAVSVPVVENGHSHPINDSETYETRTETVDEKFKAIPSTQSDETILETEADTTAIKFGEVPALSSDVMNIESEVSAEAANDFVKDPVREACALDSVESAVDVKAASELMLPREVPCDDGPVSESELVKNPVDVKAETEVEDSLVFPREVPHDDGPQSESVSAQKPIDMTAESQVENSSMCTEELPCGDGPASESQVFNNSAHSGGRTLNDLQVENKGNQLFSIDDDEKKSEGTVVANADNQGEASASSPEGIDGQNLVVEGAKRPFYYMIKIPRYDYSEGLREKIKHAQNQVDEKTKSRDVIRDEMQKQRACFNEFGTRLDDAISEETAARDLLKAKRKEIDSVLLVINKVRSALDVGDIDSKIRNMEHVLQHETLALKEEKNYIRTIQQLKQTREQLSSSLGNQEDVQEALNQKEQVEERLKNLKKEADQLRENVLKAEGASKIANKKYQDEKTKLNDLTMQFRSANDVRQQAYADLQSLRKQLYNKNKYFWEYKDDAKAAYDLASKGDKDELQSHCINQVERVMELWNNNDDFRNEYVRCNIRSTLKRLGTVDGRSLGPDEEPLVIPYVTERAMETIVPPISTIEEENTVVPVKKTENKDDKSPEKLANQSKPTAKSKKPAPSGNDIATFSQSTETEEEENKPTKEEAELIRKAEELIKEEEATILREQRRLEEKAKAKEAVERKKRNADKAQARAVARAQKEGEQKEKEREKRARKKEKRKALEEVNVVKEAESAPGSEIPPETKVCETENKPITQTKRSQKPSSQFTKQIKPKPSMPLPLRNRSKRRMQTWMWALVAALLILSIFLVGNGNLSVQRFGF